MGDTFALMRTLEESAPASAIIVGAGYIGLEMADALTTRGMAVTQIEQLPEVLPTVAAGLGHLVSRARNSMKICGKAFEDLVGGLGPAGGPGVLVPGLDPVADVAFRNSLARWRRWIEPMTSPLATSRAANNVVMPCRR
jgi:hypothetical protein